MKILYLMALYKTHLPHTHLKEEITLKKSVIQRSFLIYKNLFFPEYFLLGLSDMPTELPLHGLK